MFRKRAARAADKPPNEVSAAFLARAARQERRESRAAKPSRAFAGSVSVYCFLILALAVLMNRPNDLSFFRFSTYERSWNSASFLSLR